MFVIHFHINNNTVLQAHQCTRYVNKGEYGDAKRTNISIVCAPPAKFVYMRNPGVAGWKTPFGTKQDMTRNNKCTASYRDQQSGQMDTHSGSD